MWNNLPIDLLAHIFSFLSPDSLARASSICLSWHACAKLSNLRSTSKDQLPWFLALPTRNHDGSLCCYVHNPVTDKWHVLSLDFLPDPVRPVSSIGSLLLLRPTNSTILRLILCNPFTRRFKYLPSLNISRSNPAVGVVVEGPFPFFRIYVAGGMSEEEPRNGGATYESTVEVYDSRHDRWQIVGPMPVEFAVRLTVWTPNESVFTTNNGVLYWITSARAYSVMGFDIRSNTWRELSVPMADRLEFATLVSRNGALLSLVGGTCGGNGWVWELGAVGDGEDWCLIEKVPTEMGRRLMMGGGGGAKASWGSTRCVGGNGAICLYREVGSGMIVWREDDDDEQRRKWEWIWVDGCSLIRGKQVVQDHVAIKGVLLHPCLAVPPTPTLLHSQLT